MGPGDDASERYLHESDGSNFELLSGTRLVCGWLLLIVWVMTSFSYGPIFLGPFPVFALGDGRKELFPLLLLLLHVSMRVCHVEIRFERGNTENGKMTDYFSPEKLIS